MISPDAPGLVSCVDDESWPATVTVNAPNPGVAPAALTVTGTTAVGVMLQVMYVTGLAQLRATLKSLFIAL